MLRGGGLAFGPRPRDFSSELPKKVYDLAWRTALSYRFRKGELIIVDNAMEIESPSPRLLNDVFKYHEKLRGKGRNLMVTLEERPLLEDALEQMGRGGQALTWEEVDVKNLLELSRVIIERDALHNILLSHQEDLTHTSLQPWHKSFIRKSPPSELESIVGWSEFRELQQIQDLDPKQLDVARPTLYEDVANKRYEHAASLPNGPQRADLIISAYNLLAEAKELHFQRISGGLSWSDYAKHGSAFPRSQQLGYQRSLLYNRASSAAEVSALDAEVLELEAAQLELEEQENMHEAAILAAQVWEHRAEAQRLAGEEDAAEESIALASDERVKVEERDMERLKVQLDVARREVKVATMKKDWQGQTKAQARVQNLTKEVERKENELMAQQEVEFDDVEAVEEIAKVEGEKK
jgi:large subunit ribosomal protein L4